MMTHNPLTAQSGGGIRLVQGGTRPAVPTSVLAAVEMGSRHCQGRDGRELWGIARSKVLRYGTIKHITENGVVNRRMSTTLDTVRELLNSESKRYMVRRLKYPRTPLGLLRQIVDEYNDAIDSLTSSWLDRSGTHPPVWTFMMVVCNMSVFFFMAAEWRVVEDVLGWGPGMGNMFNYLSPTEDTIVFEPTFLIDWGARSLWHVFEEHEWWRWISSNVIHTSLRHCMSNMVMVSFLGVILEMMYGVRITMIVWLISAFAGNMFAATFEDPCAALSGASGSAFGLIGFYISDTIVRWRKMRRPMMRTLMILVLLCQFGLSIMHDSGNVSHFSHLGGMVAGMASSIIMLPEIANVYIRRTLPLLCVIMTISCAIVMPVYVYTEGPEEVRACSFNGTASGPLIRIGNLVR